MSVVGPWRMLACVFLVVLAARAPAEECPPLAQTCWNHTDCTAGYPYEHCECPGGDPPCPILAPGCCAPGCVDLQWYDCTTAYGCEGHQFCRDGSLEDCIAYDLCECTSATQQQACVSPDTCAGVQWCIPQPSPVLGQWGPCQAVDDDTECLVQSEVRECIVLEGLSGCPGTQTCDGCHWSPCEP